MNHMQLVSGRDLLNNFDSSIITDPVFFPNHPAGGANTRTFFSRATMVELFRLARVNIARRSELNSPRTEEEMTELQTLTNQLRSYERTGNLDGNFLQPGQTRCPITRCTLQESDMQPAKLFGHVFIIAARNAIIQNPREFVRFTRRVDARNTVTITSEMKPGVAEIREALTQLNATDIPAAEMALDALIQNRNSTFLDWQVQQLRDLGIDGRPNNINVRTTRRGATNTVIQSILDSETVPNTPAVKAFAHSLIELRAEVDKRARELIQATTGNTWNERESSMDDRRIGAANHFFATVVQRAFAKKFREYGNDDAVCIEKIFSEIKTLILDEIVKDCLQTERQVTRNASNQEHAKTKKEEARALRTWIEANKKILLDTAHSQHSTKLTESLTYLKSKTDSRQIAWRTFVPDAPLHSWYNLFTLPLPHEADSRNNECRLRLAYYYLVATDKTQSPETVEARTNNFISCLAEIRRAHNDGTRRDANDSPSCYPGHISRMALMGKDHPVAHLPMTAAELLPIHFQAFVTLKIGEALSECQNYDQKVSLFSALTECSATTAEDIKMDAVKYSDSLLKTREEFVHSLGEFKELVEMINAELARLMRSTGAPARSALESDDENDDENDFICELNPDEIKMLRLMLLDVGAYALETITNAFKNSLTAAEIRRWDEEHPDAALSISFEHNTDENEDPFPPLSEQQELSKLPKTMDEAQKIKIVLKKILVNRISSIIYRSLLRANIVQNRELIIELANGLGQDFAATAPTATDERRKMLGGASQTTRELSHLSSTQQQEIARNLIAELDQQIFKPSNLVSTTTASTVSASATTPSAPAVLQISASSRFRIQENVGLRDYRRLTLGINNVQPYRMAVLPQLPIVHPFNLTGYDERSFRRQETNGIPAFRVVAALPRIENLPSNISEVLQQNNINPNQLEVFFCVQDMPWQNETLLFRPHPWLHPDAPTTGRFNNSSNIVAGISNYGDIGFAGYGTSFNQASMERGTAQTHSNISGGRTSVGFSPGSSEFRVRGVEDYNVSHNFFSLCINVETQRAALTYHWLLNDQDDAQIASIVNNCNENTTLDRFLSRIRQQETLIYNMTGAVHLLGELVEGRLQHADVSPSHTNRRNENNSPYGLYHRFDETHPPMASSQSTAVSAASANVSASASAAIPNVYDARATTVQATGQPVVRNITTLTEWDRQHELHQDVHRQYELYQRARAYAERMQAIEPNNYSTHYHAYQEATEVRRQEMERTLEAVVPSHLSSGTNVSAAAATPAVVPRQVIVEPATATHTASPSGFASVLIEQRAAERRRTDLAEATASNQHIRTFSGSATLGNASVEAASASAASASSSTNPSAYDTQRALSPEGERKRIMEASTAIREATSRLQATIEPVAATQAAEQPVVRNVTNMAEFREMVSQHRLHERASTYATRIQVISPNSFTTYYNAYLEAPEKTRQEMERTLEAVVPVHQRSGTSVSAAAATPVSAAAPASAAPSAYPTAYVAQSAQHVAESEQQRIATAASAARETAARQQAELARQQARRIERARTYATRIQALESNSYQRYYDAFLAASETHQQEMERKLESERNLTVRCKNYAQDVLQIFALQDRTPATENHHFFGHYNGTEAARLASEQALEDTLRARGLRRTARFTFPE